MIEEFLRDNWLSVAAFLVNGVWAWAWWSLRKQFVTVESHGRCQQERGARFTAVEARMEALAHRLDLVERDVKGLPTVQGISNLNVELEKVRGELQGFRGEMAGQRDFMKRMERQLGLLVENELRGARNV